MGIFTPDVMTLREAYMTELRRALDMEKQIVNKGLPTMIESATSPELVQAFQTHLEESREHVTRLERILGDSDEKSCKVASALISAGSSNISDAGDNAIRDVILIASGNQVEHHEIAVYGTLRTWAEVLGEDEAANILEMTLEEEKKADALLTSLATQINVEAPTL